MVVVEIVVVGEEGIVVADAAVGVGVEVSGEAAMVAEMGMAIGVEADVVGTEIVVVDWVEAGVVDTEIAVVDGVEVAAAVVVVLAEAGLVAVNATALVELVVLRIAALEPAVATWVVDDDTLLVMVVVAGVAKAIVRFVGILAGVGKAAVVAEEGIADT